jgi:hypothetical protein
LIGGIAVGGKVVGFDGPWFEVRVHGRAGICGAGALDARSQVELLSAINPYFDEDRDEADDAVFGNVLARIQSR